MKYTAEDYKDALEGVLWQVGHRFSRKRGIYISSGALSDVEYGFKVMGWSDPRKVPLENACDIVGCFEWPSGQGPWDGLYVCLCPAHWSAARKGDPRPKVRQYRLKYERTRCPKCHVAELKKGRSVIPHTCQP